MKLTKQKLEQLIKESFEETEEEKQNRFMSKFATTFAGSPNLEGVRQMVQIGEQMEYIYPTDGVSIEKDNYGDPMFTFKVQDERLYGMILKALQIQAVRGNMKDKSTGGIASFERDFSDKDTTSTQQFLLFNDDQVVVKFSSFFF